MNTQTFWDKLKYLIKQCYYDDNKGLEKFLEFDPICQGFMEKPYRFDCVIISGSFSFSGFFPCS